VISLELEGVDDPNALLEGILAHAPLAFQIYRADGRCLFVNAAFRALFGAEPPPEYDIFKDERLARQGVLDHVRRAFAGETVHMPAHWYEPEALKGRRVAVEVTLFPLFDRKHAVRHVAVCIRDVTSEQELSVSEARYRTQFEAAPEAIVTLDVDRRCFVEVNANAERLFGRPRSELLTLTPIDVSPPTQPDGRPSAEAAGAYIQRALDGERPVFEWTHRHAAGQDVPCEVRLVRLPGTGQNLCRGSIIDISERKRAEAEKNRLEETLRRMEDQLRQAQKMEAIGRLAGGVAHDFNNLLSVILGYSELLLGSLPSDGPTRAEVEAIWRAGQQAAALTFQLLAFSRHQVLTPRLVDLAEVVRESEKMLRRLLGEDVDLVIEIGADLAQIRVDPGQIGQVVMNLALNARDAMPGGGTLTIEIENVALDESYATEHLDVRPGSYVMLAVSDSGVGMDEETRARVFEPFFTTKSKGQGTGLGLSTVFGIVKQSNGGITVDSQPGGGSTFKVFLPAAAGEADASLVKTVPPSGLHGSETILLVEDQDEVRRVAGEILNRYGYSVLEARDASQALRFCEQQHRRIDLLLTDLVMPKISGRELAERVLGLRPGMRVLFMSGYTEDAVVHRGILESGVWYLQKPLVPEGLARRIREVLDTRPEPGPAR
jgi:two-component system, cell cycle sensor histidine kinase and response regulator CckA